MKKVSWIIGLILLIFLGDRVGGLILEKLTISSEFRYSRLYNGSAEADILLLGNSRGLMFFQPYIEEITGMSTLNLSYNAMPIDLAKKLVEDYLEKYKAPKLMLIDVTMCDRENDQLISGFGTYRSFSNGINELLEERVPKSYYGGLVSKLFNYNSEIFHRSLYYQNKSDEDWLLDRVINQNLIDNVEKEKNLNFELSDYILENLVATIKIAEEKGVKVKLLINPYYPPFTKKLTNINVFANKIHTATNLEIHDFSNSLKKDEFFGDYQHLNKVGSFEFIDILNNDNVFE